MKPSLLADFAVTVILACLVPSSAQACSMAGCLNDGVEMKSSFVVLVHHADEPVENAQIKISGNGRAFTLLTSPGGRSRITDLSPGTYWIEVEFLNIGAGYHCFHVAQQPTSKAKKALSYDWGDEAPATQRVAGKMLERQPGKSDHPLWNLLHPVEVPIVGAKLKLQNAMTGDVFWTTSDSQGEFAFDSIPDATYVLHVEGGSADGHDNGASDHLIAVGQSARLASLTFVSNQLGGGGCGGPSLELKDPA